MYVLTYPSPWHKLCFLGNQTSSSAWYFHLEEMNSGCKTGFYKPFSTATTCMAMQCSCDGEESRASPRG